VADLDVTKKLSVYHLIYRLNLSFTNIVRRCRELEDTRVFPARFLRIYQGYAQELQAEINFELVETLNSLEGNDWFRYGKVRQKREKELRDPDDVFIHAEERRQELRRQGKTPPGEPGKRPMAKRKLFTELMEGVAAMRTHRQGKVTSRSHKARPGNPGRRRLPRSTRQPPG
jgi:hypothetical protein